MPNKPTTSRRKFLATLGVGGAAAATVVSGFDYVYQAARASAAPSDSLPSPSGGGLARRSLGEGGDGGEGAAP